MAFDMKWLNQKREMAKMAKLQQQPNKQQYFSSPLGSRYNTGYGEDGINQPSNPVMNVPTTNGRRTIHEGEDLRPMPNGQIQVVSQKQLKDEELVNKTPGYKQGGIFTPAKGKTLMGRNTGFKAPGNYSAQSLGPESPKKKGDVPDIIDPVIDPIRNVGPDGNIIKDPIINPIRNVGPDGQIIKDPIIQTIGPDGQIVKDPVVDPIQGSTDQLTTDPLSIVQSGSIDRIPTGTTTTTDQDPDKSPYEEYYEQTLARLNQLAQSGSTAERLNAQKQLADLKATQDIERQVEAQQMAQERVGGAEAYGRRLMGQAQRGADLAGAEAAIGIEDMRLREQAQRDMAGLAMQGMQFDFMKEQYGDQEGMRMAQEIAKGASFEWMKQKYPNLTQEDYNSMRKWADMGWMQEQYWNSDMWKQKQWDFAMQQYGDDRGRRISEEIGRGSTYERVKQLFPEVTKEDYDQMQKWSQMGWAREQWKTSNNQ